MDKNNFFNLLETQTRNIRDSSGAKDENDKLVNLLKLVLERLKSNRSSSNVFNEYDRLELKRLFVTLCMVAQESHDFIASASMGDFNPAKSSDEMSKRLADVITNINEVQSDIKDIERDSAELEKQEVLLRKREADREKARQKADELKEIHANAKRDIENYQQQCKELLEQLESIDSKRRNYSLHLDANSEIVTMLRGIGLTSIKELLDGINEFDNAVRKELERYDSKIKAIIERKEQLKIKVESL